MNSAIKIESGFFQENKVAEKSWDEITIGKIADIPAEETDFIWIKEEDEEAPQVSTINETSTDVAKNQEISETPSNVSIPVGTPPLNIIPEITRDPLLETEAVTRFKENLKNHCEEILHLHFNPLKYLYADLFGQFHLATKIDIFQNETEITDREKMILAQLLEELVLHCKYGSCNQDTIELITPYLLKEKREAELLTLVEKNLQQINVDYKIFLDLAGIKRDSSQVNTIAPNTEIILEICYLFKYAKINIDQENILFDTVVSRENPTIFGLPYLIFKKREDHARAIQTLFTLGQEKEFFLKFSQKEKERFVNDYKHEREYLNLYFLLKHVYPREIIKKWAEKEKLKSGKIIDNSIDESMSLAQKFEQLQSSNLVYTLHAFELLLLLNSEKAEDVKKDITEAHKRLPHSYLTNKSMAVLKFFEEEFNAFFYYLDRAGRLQYQPENLYLKALAYMETGEQQKGKKIITALQIHFPKSTVLENATSLYKI